MILEAENISKSFEKKQVLRSASIRIDEAEIVGLFGESGCGKSTLAKIICGLCKADGGRLTRLDKGVQMVYQQPWSAMDPSQRIGKSIEEIIKYNKLADGKEEIAKLLDQSLAELGLGKNIKRQLPRQISGGEAQRVSLAKALLFQPKLLILDEATSMLDVQTQAEIIEIIKKIKNEKKCGVLLISHDMEFMQDVCDRIYILENGETRNYENA